MADTRGFAVVVEARESVLTKALKGAWKSAECPEEPGDEGRIPETFQIDEADGFMLGGYVVEDGQIQLPRDDLSASLAPVIDGTELHFGLEIQVQIKDPPVPSATLMSMSATVNALAPIRVPDGEKQVFIILDGIPLDAVSATLASGDPLASKHNQFVREYIHILYEENGSTFPHSVTEPDLSWNFGVGSVTLDSYTEIYDDLGDPAHAIEVTGPFAGRVQISIPIYLRLYNIETTGAASFLSLEDPMGIETRIILDAPFETPDGWIRVDMGAADVSVAPIAPAGPVHGEEGPNYTANKAALGAFINLDTLLTTELRTRGQEMAAAIGLKTFAVPTIAQIEAAIAQYFHAELVSRNRISVWTPGDAPEVDLTLNDVTSRAHPTFLALGLNKADGSDIGALGDFIPDDRDFAIALSAAQCNAAFAKALDDSGLASGDLPKRISVDDDDVDINSVNVALGPGALIISGNVTVIDAILGSIDVDADFSSLNGLEWQDSGDNQVIRDFQIGEPNIDPEESVAAWVIGLLIGILTGGLGGALIAALILLIVQAIVNGIAQSIGASVVKDEVSDSVVGFGGWPERLSRIGFVRTRFENPITIDPTGIVMAGNLEVVSSCESTAIAFADSGSSYSASAASALVMEAQTTHADAAYQWLAGDGSLMQPVQNLTHSYVQSGLYIAKHALTIEQPGGVRTRHFAAVTIANVQPSMVDAGPDITVNEGEVVTLVGRFRDIEYPDTHETSWIFGDCQDPQPGVVSETNVPPAAMGTSTVTHAWCDNGVYTVTFTVRDQNGGLRQDTRTVTVLNVPPVVEAGPDMFAYSCMPITMVARFTDAGWCDTHVATWDFGDCTGPRAAIVEEVHEPPQGEGTATATHIYKACGTFEAACVVTDDDGGIGEDRVRIDVVHFKNPDFELGYRDLAMLAEAKLAAAGGVSAVQGRVANFWTPYQSPSRRRAALQPSSTAGNDPRIAAAYDCEECVVRDGQRSQAITPLPEVRAGVYQKLGANPGWTYEFLAWAFTGARTVAWLGIDPEGGSDPDAEHIRWMGAQNSELWTSLAVRDVARAQAVTLFLEIETAEHAATGYLDSVSFTAQQPICPEEEPEEPEDKRPVPRACLKFDDMPPRGTATSYQNDGFLIETQGQELLHAVHLADLGMQGLMLTPAGIVISFPFPASTVIARVVTHGGKPPVIAGYNAAGDPVANAQATPEQGKVQTLTLSAAGMTAAMLKGHEAVLIELCITRDPSSPPKARDDREPAMPPTDPRTGTTPSRAKLDSELRAMLPANAGASGKREVDVLIQLVAEADQPRPADKQGDAAGRFEAEAKPVHERLSALGGKEVRNLWIARTVTARVPVAALEALAEHPQVRAVILDRKHDILTKQGGSDG